MDSTHRIPWLSGEHEQPVGHGLKAPAIGDVIVFNEVNEAVETWGYLIPFIKLVERKYAV